MTPPNALSEERVRELREMVFVGVPITNDDQLWRRVISELCSAWLSTNALRREPGEVVFRSHADCIPTDEIVSGLKSIELAVNSGKWNGELVWIRRACRRFTGEDGYAALASSQAGKWKCARCEGRGVVRHPGTVDYMDPCPDCSQAGKCGTCGGSGFTYPVGHLHQSQTCMDCNGTGTRPTQEPGR